MADLVASRITQNYHFNFPDGLKELMTDLSREVLRAQPKNIYSFIADYLSALLVIREHLNIASRICTCVTEKELAEMLRDMGLEDDAVATALAIVTKYLDTPNVKESKVLSKVIRRVKIKEHHIQLILDAVRAAHLQHKLRKENITKKLFKDETEAAVQYTLDLYKQTKPTDEEYTQMKNRIKASYEAYGIKRQIHDSASSSSSDISFYPWFSGQQSPFRFSSSDDEDSDSGKMIYEDQEIILNVLNNKMQNFKVTDSAHQIVQDKIALINNIENENILTKKDRHCGVVTFYEASSTSDVISSSDEEAKVSRTTEAYQTMHAVSMNEIDDIDAVDNDPIEYD